MRLIESKHQPLHRLWQDVNVLNLKALFDSILQLETDISSERFNESGMQASIESALHIMFATVPFSQKLSVRASFNENKHECDLGLALNDPDARRTELILVELKRLTSGDITVNPAFASAHATVASNCIIGLSEEQLYALTLKEKAKHMYKALDVAGVVKFAKDQVGKQANDLLREPKWMAYTIRKFVAVLVVDRLIVASAD